MNKENQKVRWGVLGTANFGRTILPAMQRCQFAEVHAVASRSLESAKAYAKELAIPKAYGSYEEILRDPEVDAIYIPLPNHIHIGPAKQALEAGKHVLCEKPISVNAADALELLEFSKKFPRLKIAEAFMYRYHPQWIQAKRWITEGKIGTLRMVQVFFAYYNVDASNIRNQSDVGGGGLLDIGCYCVSSSRWICDREPERVIGLFDKDPSFGTDRLASGILDFGNGLQASFTCSTQVAPYQRVNILGTHGRVEIDIPFNAPPDRPCRVSLYPGTHSAQGRFEPTESQVLDMDICDQYTLQGEAISLAILNDEPVPYGLEDAVGNMRTLEALRQSNESSAWIAP